MRTTTQTRLPIVASIEWCRNLPTEQVALLVKKMTPQNRDQLYKEICNGHPISWCPNLSRSEVLTLTQRLSTRATTMDALVELNIVLSYRSQGLENDGLHEICDLMVEINSILIHLRDEPVRRTGKRW